MTIGFDQTFYRVNELVGEVEVCVSVRGGVALDREVVVQYGTADQSAVGMECVFWSTVYNFKYMYIVLYTT